MDTRKLLIADGSEEFRTALANALPGNFHIRLCADGREALSLLRSFRPDLLVLDLMLPGLDGISLLHAASGESIFPVVLATSRFLTEYMSESVDKLGISYVMIKPCDIAATVSRLQDLTHRIHPPTVAQPDPRTLVSNALISLGFSTNLRGYTYLREAILLMMKDPDQAITKELYPAVGLLCDSNREKVERSIRSAIQSAWEARDDRIWLPFFPAGADGTIPRPSNAQFICRLADAMILHAESSL